jgi:hypothetical protein
MQAIRPNLARMPQLPEPSVTEHLFWLAGAYKKPDGTVDREALSAAMKKNEWLESRTKPGEVKDRIETACWQVESNLLSEGRSWALSLRLG